MDEFGTGQGGAETQKAAAAVEDDAAPDALKGGAALMQEEDRVVGQVQWRTYARYFQAAGGVAWMPWLLACLSIGQALTGARPTLLPRVIVLMGEIVGSNLFLGWWTGRTIPGFGDGQYIAVYASLGAGEALFSFITAFSFRCAARWRRPHILTLEHAAWLLSPRAA